MTRSAIHALLPVFAVTAGLLGFAAVPRFEKVSDHCYYFQSKEETANVVAVVSDEGVLLVNPPADSEHSALDAIRRLSTRPVRWVINTDYRLARSGGTDRFVEQGALLLGSRQIFELTETARASVSAGVEQPDRKIAGSDSTVHLMFQHQMRLFPGGTEVRVLAVQHKACTGGDVVVFVPSEKVLIVGNLFVEGRYPDIDSTPGGGSALGWLDAMKEVIDAVPLLKAAIPPKIPPKAEVKPGEEKSLEESIIVISAHGPQANLQDMKDLLDAAHKLRGETAKAVSAGRELDSFLTSPALEPFRSYEGFVPFVRQLFDELPKK
ncbi:MAG TPA: hypothetical protein VE398_14510 [Acidobacteriota bacterium]|nr:hypothetical protein [Acidobacteriota bacterium]